jgi:hypothetical protein
MFSAKSKSRLNVLPLLLLRVAFTAALTFVFTGVVGTHAEAATRLPDLIVSAVSAPSTAQSGQSFVLSASIKNQGRATSSAFSVSYYGSTSASSISGAVLLGVQNVASLRASASIALVTSLAIPPSAPSGTFYLVAVADSANVVLESKETNNTRASGAIAVKDLTPPTISGVNATGITASNATITWTTNETSTSQAEYGPTAAYGSFTSPDSSLVTSHAVSLSGLTAGKAYHFMVHSKDAAGNAVLSSDFTFMTAATTAEAVSYYQTIYDAEYQTNKSTLDAMAASGDGETYYTFQYVFGGTLSIYEATKDPKYLERALTWAETMVSKATIMDNNGNLNWSGPWLSPYSATPIAYQLFDLQGSTELARLARIIVTDSTLNSTYGIRAQTIHDFVKKQIVDKWLYTRGSESWFVYNSVTFSKDYSDKCALLVRILTDLYRVGDTSYLTLATEMVNGFKNRLVVFTGNSLIWDQGLNSGAPGYAPDTAHANRYPDMVVDAINAGIGSITNNDLTKISSLLTAVIWDQSTSNPQFTNYIDGNNDLFGTRPAWNNGLIYSGWVKLAEYDAGVLAVSDATLKAIVAGTSNPSLDYMNNMHGKISLSGHLAKAVAH